MGLSCPALNCPQQELISEQYLGKKTIAEGIQYRVIGMPGTAYPNAREAEPSLEDGYIWLMKNQ